MQAGPRFAWSSSSLRNNKGLLLGNFRFLPDRNGYTEAGFEADNSTITAPVNAYLPNSYGIYNMSGNVSEWVQDRYSLDIVTALMLNPEEKILPDFSKMRTLYQLEGENATVEFLFTELMKINPKKLPSKEIDISIFKEETLLPFIYDYIRFEQEDSNQRNFYQLVKGGSWFDGPYALQIGARQILKQQCSSRVGFRMAMSIN
jgi:formylglycine-generating enzyme required for sulfatase activity